jgi:hypothetical protein
MKKLVYASIVMIVLQMIFCAFKITNNGAKVSMWTNVDLRPKVLCQWNMDETNSINETNASVLLHFDGSDGSTTITDSSYYNLSGSISGNTNLTISVSKFGTASCYFDGASDAILYNNETAFTLGTGDFTIDFWYKLVGTSATQVFYEGRSATSTVALMIYFNGSTKKLVVGNDNETMITSTNTFNDTNWHHIAVTRGSGNIKLFVDGNQEGPTYTTAKNLVGASGKPWFGCTFSNASPFNGYIDEFRITKGYAQWTENFTPPTSAYSNTPVNPILYLDSVGSYPLTVSSSQWTNNVSVSGVVETGFDTRYAYWAYSAELNSYLSENCNSNIALSFWVYVDNVSGIQYGIFQIGSFNVNYGGLGLWGNNGSLSLRFNSTDLAPAVTHPPISGWSHVVVIFNKPNYKYYIDGVLKHSGTYNKNLYFGGSSTYFGIGNGYVSYLLDGKFDNIVLMDDEPTYDEIRFLYQKGRGNQLLYGRFSREEVII